MYYEYLGSCVPHVEAKCRTATDMSKQQATRSIRHVERRILQVACYFDMLHVAVRHVAGVDGALV